jgi:hypothetical protein
VLSHVRRYCTTRLVGWNANYNNYRRTFEESVALLEPFAADVLVISETQPP